ncbi:permease [Puniceicoccaceae bacterium K14]|nr:permease [Puniceicoccaceae bacterium K14]
MNFLQKYISAVWGMVLEMAPYLIIGFAIAGVLHKLINQSWIEKRLGKPGLSSTILASLVGVPMPLCSCGVVPVTASIRNKGASKGATTSFLTSTPQTGIDSIMATYGMLGPLFAVYRVIVAFVSGIFVGVAVESFSKDKSKPTKVESIDDTPSPSWKSSIVYAFATLPQSIGNSLLIGFLLAGAISAAAPENFLENIPGGIYSSIFLTTLIAIPLYVCSTGSIPLAIALITSGLPISAALVLLIAGPATNAATIVTMRKIIGPKETTIYLICIIISSWIAALLFHIFLGQAAIKTASIHHHTTHGLISTISAITLLAMIALPYLEKFRSPVKKSDTQSNAVITLSVNGMSCNHCKHSVIEGLSSLPETDDVAVDLSKGIVTVSGQELRKETLSKKIQSLGFEVSG